MLTRLMASTRQRCKRLSTKELARIHDELRKSSDFAARITEFLGNSSPKPEEKLIGFLCIPKLHRYDEVWHMTPASDAASHSLRLRARASISFPAGLPKCRRADPHPGMQVHTLRRFTEVSADAMRDVVDHERTDSPNAANFLFY